VALLGRRRQQAEAGGARSTLLDVADALGAEFVAPSTGKGLGVVRGRMSGCTFELSVATAERARPQGLTLTVRHFHTQKSWHLDRAGCTLPDLDAPAIQAAVESACHSFSTTH
jgi:hypothetical protein